MALFLSKRHIVSSGYSHILFHRQRFYWFIAVLCMIGIDILDDDLPESDADVGSMNAFHRDTSSSAVSA